jgi:hypothetical protein
MVDINKFTDGRYPRNRVGRPLAAAACVRRLVRHLRDRA